MKKSSRIFIAGHKGMVGSAIVRNLKSKGYENLIMVDRKRLDLTRQDQVRIFFDSVKPEYVIVAAAKVGGIHANNIYRGEFLRDNLMIQTNLIHASYEHNVSKLLFLGSSCIYPKNCPQPIKEEYLLSGALEPTNEPYAIAKIAGVKMCDAYRAQYGCNFISAMPTNLYGPNDNYDLENSHVLPALIRKFHTAKINYDKEVTIWGTGTPKREFLHVDDLAEACYFLMQKFNQAGHINIGSGQDISIMDLAKLVKRITGYKGNIVNDVNKPDGTPRKLLDVSRINEIGWKSQIELEEGIRSVYSNLYNEPWYSQDSTLSIAV